MSHQLPELPTPSPVFGIGAFYSADQMRAYAELAIASVKPNQFTGTAAFKNFHRNLCERFGYFHDEQYWWRDLVSLEEHITASVKREPQWLPIESAPKCESTSFLVLLPKCAKHEECAVQVSNFQGDMYPDYLGGSIDFDDRIISAIGWMPLPQPPITGSEGDGNG